MIVLEHILNLGYLPFATRIFLASPLARMHFSGLQLP